MTEFEKLIEDTIDEIVNEIDYDIWKGSYNLKTAEEPEFVANNRERLFYILDDLITKARNFYEDT